jgi:prepilin signal peptidase PulO-like enzyme (type II secretory pathway)
MIDLKFGIIPDKIILFGALATIVYLLIANSSSFLNCLLSAVGGFLFFLFLVVITKGRGMGMGDAKFAILIGLLLGFPIAAFSFYLAFLTGALVSIILILIGKKRFKKDTIPFGPFLAFSAFLNFFFGSYLFDLFIKILSFGK